MKNEDILLAAQKEKNRGQEYESKASVKSSLLGSAVAVLVGVVLFMLEYLIKDSVNVGLIAVGMTASGVQSLVEGIKVKKTYLIVIGSVQLLIALCAVFVFVSQMFSKVWMV